MLVTFLLWPIFFVLGLLFGFFSPIFAICKACAEETGKWQAYVRYASAVSRGHQERIKMLARCVLVFECWDTLRGQRVFLDYYKLGHHVGFSLHIIIVSIIKFALFNPFWGALTTSLEDLEQMDEEATLGESLLRSRTNRSGARVKRERPSKTARFKSRDIGVEPETNSVENDSQPGERVRPKPYLPTSGDNGEWRRTRHDGYGGQQHYVFDNDDTSISKGKKSSAPDEEEPWGDWGAS